MSIMSSLVNHDIQDLPNAVHNTPKEKPENSVLSAQAHKHLHAMKENAVRPAMFYGPNIKRPYKNGVWQNDEEVAREVEYREETPRG